MPVANTTASVSMLPCSVSTPETAPAPVRSPVTATSSTMRTPRLRAPLAKAMVVSTGEVWPSRGMYRAPTRSSVRISGQRSRTSSMPISRVSTPHRHRHRRAPPDLLPALGVGRHRDRPGRAVSGGLAGLVLERLEERGRVGGQLGEAVGGLELRHEPGRMPCGAAGELALLEHHHVGDPPPGQVVGHAAAHDAAADNNDLRTFRQHPDHRAPPSSRRQRAAGRPTRWRRVSSRCQPAEL